jgi:1-aminocyclopropane-1-carboxylate deaminase/D-cysteine desulfhydrase-like pyridoxal-dependent ACC family enzyme
VSNDPLALTPVEERNGLLYKREDHHRNAYGVNGAKYRACRHMMVNAIMEGYDHVVSAQSVLSPQSSICATLAEELGIGCTLVYGASKRESALKHPNVRIAAEAGAMMDFVPRVAYNGVIQPYARSLAEELGAWHLPYAISMPENAARGDLQDFLAVGGAQTANIPDEARTLVMPFGSGNTAAGVLYGLSRLSQTNIEKVVLVGIGPDRYDWLAHRLEVAGARHVLEDLEVERIPLHPHFATYGDRMPETLDGIVLHPTYEGKVARYLNETRPAWWTARDGSTLFWIVGGPLP